MHSWNLSNPQAKELQTALAKKIDLTPLAEMPTVVGGADISFNLKDSTIFAGIVILKIPTLEVIETQTVTTQATFPYIPGLLSFREMPPLIEVWDKLSQKPDLLFLDGQGIAHPRRFGLACHAGLWFNIPTIGCAKTRYIGKYENPEIQKGSYSPLIDNEETIGYVLRTKNKVNPVFISPGHKITLQQSVEVTLSVCGKYRIPEPTRQAHLLVNEARKAFLE